MKTKWVRNT
jgi:hypothetical protein